MAVAARMNMAIYNEVGVGNSARVAGRCEFQPESQQWILQTFEGAKLPVQNSSGMEMAPNQLVELIGTKGPEGQLLATAICKLPEGEMDGDLWNQAVQMAHHQKLKHLFQPIAWDGKRWSWFQSIPIVGGQKGTSSRLLRQSWVTT